MAQRQSPLVPLIDDIKRGSKVTFFLSFACSISLLRSLYPTHLSAEVQTQASLRNSEQLAARRTVGGSSIFGRDNDRCSEVGKMKSSIKIIKRKDADSIDLKTAEGEKSVEQSTREMVTTVKGWIAERQQRKRAQSQSFSHLTVFAAAPANQNT